MKALFYLAIFTVVTVSACKKDIKEPETPPATAVTNFKEIKASENFDWKTSNEFTLQVKGFTSLVPVTGTLIISSIDGLTVYYQVLHAMDQSATIKFSLPIDVKEYKVNYGSISKQYSTVTKTAEFDFVIDYPEELGE